MNAWIVNRSYDLKFFIGCVVLSPLCFLSFIGLVELFDWSVDDSALAVYVAFLLLFDQPHIWQSLSRSHFDSAEFGRNRVRHIAAPLLIVALAPLYYFLGFEAALLFVFTYYGMWHIFRQNVGLLRVYQRRGGLERADRWLDWLLYYSLFLSGFVPEVLTSPYTAEVAMEYLGEDVLVSGAGPALVAGVSDTLFVIFLVFALLWLLRQAFALLLADDSVAALKARAPRYAFMGATAAVYAFLFLVLNELFVVPLIIYVACDTIYHDIQYFGWMKRYNQAVFPDRPNRFRKWMVAGYLYSAAAVAVYFLMPELFEWGEIVSFTIIMFVLYHYYLDGHIWRFRKSPELGAIIS